MELYITVAAVAYWTFAVVLAALAVNQVNNSMDMLWVVGIAAIWPLAALFMLIALPYQAAVASTKRIQNDLQNRGLLREFQQWLRERDQTTASKKQ